MTYCLAIKVDEGIVIASDTRTNAGVDDIKTYNKIHTFQRDRFCIHILSAGNLATTQAVIHKVQQDLQDGVQPNLSTFFHMYDVTDYISQVYQNQQAKITNQWGYYNSNLTCSLLVAGQMNTEFPSIHLIDQSGRIIIPNPEKQFLQIGEVDYGKPILDRFIRNDLSIADAARCALVSIDATVRSNISVGLPLDLVIQFKDNFSDLKKFRYESNSHFFQNFQDQWKNALGDAVIGLPKFADYQLPYFNFNTLF